MKPLIRWTLGPVDDLGLDILDVSIKKMRRLYPFCDFVICYNGVDVKRLRHLNVPKLDQSSHASFFKHKPTGELWKLCPPRLRPESHELVIDNDLVIDKRIDQIDEFFDCCKTMLLTGCRKRYYGQFDKFVPEGLIINSGIYGMPPDFDFSKRVLDMCELIDSWHQDRSIGSFDDQGIIAACLISEDSIIIPPSQIFNCDMATIDVPKVNGYHFIDSNRGFYKFWNEFLSSGFMPIY